MARGRIGGFDPGRDFSLPDLDLELPPYEPAPKPPSTPEEFVRHALEIAMRHDAGNPAGQGQFLARTGTMHLEHGRPDVAIACYGAAEALLASGVRSGGNPLPLLRFYQDAADALRQCGQPRAARDYQSRHDRLLLS